MATCATAYQLRFPSSSSPESRSALSSIDAVAGWATFKPSACRSDSGELRRAFHETVVEGEDDRCGSVAKVELREDVSDVGFHGDLAHEELGGDLRVARATGHEPDHLELARREA